MKKIKNNKPHDLEVNHKLWKSGEVIELSDAEALGISDSDFELISDDAAPAIELPSNSKPLPLNSKEEK